MRPADGRAMHGAALPLTRMHSAPVRGDHLPDIPEERGMGDGGGDRPPMRPRVVVEGHGTGDSGAVLKTTAKRHSYADAVSGVGDVRQPIFDGSRRPNFDEIRRPDSDGIRLPDFDDYRRPDLDDSHQSTPDKFARSFSTDGVAGTDAPQDRRAVRIRAATRAWAGNRTMIGAR